MKNVGDTFIDSAFRRWEVITVLENYYDCKLIEYLDGFIPNTPEFQLFDVNDELFTGNRYRRPASDHFTAIANTFIN